MLIRYAKMNHLFSIVYLLAIFFVTGCKEKNNQNKPMDTDDEYGAFSGDLSADAAFDEVADIVEALAKRNDQLTALKGFCSVDVPSVRANIVMITAIYKVSGFSGMVTEDQITQWDKVISECFTNKSKWGFQEWDIKEKEEWKSACMQDILELRTSNSN